MEIRTKGKIINGVGGLYTVRLLDGSLGEPCSLIKCKARGAFRHEGLTPLPGDTVTVLAEGEESSAVIEEIISRKNSLIRPPMANLDYLFITMASASPRPDLTTLDKLIAIAEFNKIEPVVVITKNELDEKYAEELFNIYSSTTLTCFSLSSVEDRGIEPLESFISQNMSGRTAAFAGASGIGKSTLLNRLFPSLCLSTSEISRKIQRGRHTTRTVELFPLSADIECGYIADTPGFSMLDFARFDFFEKEDLISTFREFEPYIGSCKYTKCTHTKEEGCAILGAVREGKIQESRHQSYTELFETLKAKKKWN